jgi:hypothetical protein
LPIVDRPSDLTGRSENTILPVAAREPGIMMTDYQFYSISLLPLFQPHFCIDRFGPVSCADRVCTLLACTVNGTARAGSARYCSGYCGIETINQHGDNSAI